MVSGVSSKNTKSKAKNSHKERFNSTFFFKITDHDTYYPGSILIKGLNKDVREV